MKIGNFSYAREPQGMAAWFRSLGGGIAIYMALLIPVLTGTIGMAIDVAEDYMVQERLSRALDAAALAVAGSTLESQSDMQARVDAFMAQNYPPNKIGTPYNIQVSSNGDTVTVSASAAYDTTFLRFIGFNTLNVNATTVVQRQVQGLEVALVLDNTGSMADSYNGTTKISALKTAATTFVETMFSKAASPDDVRIGIVPYANSVRVGLYGIGQVPDPATGVSTGTYNGGQSFVTLPPGMVYTTNHNTSTKNYWYGCVTAHHDTGYDPTANTTMNTSSSGDRGQIWTNASGSAGHGWDPDSVNNDPYPGDTEDNYTGPWDIYNYGTINRTCTSQTCTSYYTSGWRTGQCRTYQCTAYGNYYFTTGSSPNSGCPYANVLPLSSDKATIETVLNTMQPHGSTESNVGMAWGYRLISPEEPFTEGSDWGSQTWKKAIILMTDGDNTRDGTYSYYWASSKNQIQAHTASGSYPDVPTLDDRLTAVCQNLKDKNVLVYTILFDVFGDISDATKSVYQNCATNSNMYFDAPTTDALSTTFDQIAHELSNLHISQ